MDRNNHDPPQNWLLPAGFRQPKTVREIGANQLNMLSINTWNTTIILLLLSFIRLDYSFIVSTIWFLAMSGIIISEWPHMIVKLPHTITAKFVLINALAYVALEYLTTELIDPGLNTLHPDGWVKWFLQVPRLYLETGYHIGYYKAIFFLVNLVLNSLF